jgi:hypothetical protein
VENIKYILNRFNNTEALNRQFKGTEPVPYLVLDNFFPSQTAINLERECEQIELEHWTKFTRLDSYMEECIKIEHMPYAFNIINEIHSKLGMEWLSQVTGIPDLLPDPYLVGAGYSRSYKGNCLKVHTDFNWNDKLKLHRRATLIVYLSSLWKESYGGDLEFWDYEKTGPVVKFSTLFNRCIIWEHHNRGFHGFPEPIKCPESISRNTLRLFFYSSNLDPDQWEPPHRSLYWYDKDSKTPYDDRTHR